MCERAFYPHPTADRIELIETHISYVLLTGAYAYKVKKPVTLPFLDFSTPERRRHFCLEEARLNCRGAPDVYLGVVPITRGEQGELMLGGDGPAEEYAVRMRQLPAGCLFSDLLAAGRLTATHVDTLARTLAGYHASARVADAAAGYGTPERVRDAVSKVYAAAAKYVGGALQPRARYDQTRAFTDRFLREADELMRARVAAGHVRECHGDAHLGNVCLDGDRVLLIDCIEFSESLRFLDVMNDAAFPAMDLRAAGRADLSNAFVNGYAEWTGDWAGLRVLPLYLCSRAYIRAMVHSLLSDEPGLSPAKVERARSAAARYYRLAWSYALPSPRRGRLLLVCGAAGAGKSTLARGLAQHVGAIHIRSDAVRKHLAGVPLDARGGAELYSAAMTHRTYARMLELALMLTATDFDVILDATHARRDARRAALAGARAAGIGVRVLQCVAPPDVMRARLRRRRGDVSDATPEQLDSQLAAFESFDATDGCDVRVANTAEQVDVPGLAHWAFPEGGGAATPQPWLR